MIRKRILWTILFAMLPIGQACAEEEPKLKGSNLEGFMTASATVDAFFKAMLEGDLDAVMATVDVPWFHDGKRILESKDELRDILREPIEEKELIGLKAEVKEVKKFESLRDSASGTTGELLKKVAKDSDLVFFMKVTVGTKNEEMLLLVRVKGDGAKIIGLRD